jgi:4-diphosphocytidyl-2-C-methyl-D-erythritol kinase
VLRRAYAKINLALSVGPPFPLDHPARGMHPIVSWMHAINLFDEVQIQPRLGHRRGMSRRPSFESEVHVEWADDAPVKTEIDWAPDHDLAVRALRLMEAHAGEPLPVFLHLTKRIPIGGGLGGGSSNAAAVMLATNEIFALGLTLPELVRLSRSIGSDVGFFLDDHAPPRPAIIQGTGQYIERVHRSEAELVLVCPGFGCATPDVYSMYDSMQHAPLRAEDVRSLATAAPLPAARLFNDLTAAASAVRPELDSLRARLAAATQEPVHLTGSGSTLFVITADADSTAQRLAIAAPEAKIVRTRLV